MLQSIRDRAKGWLAWVVVILISIPFALWGIQEYFGQDPNVPVASINGQELGLIEYQRAYQEDRNRLQAMFGGNFDINALDENRLKNDTLERLIQDEVLVQAGVDEGLRIADEQIVHAVQTQPTFQRDGEFSQELYEQWLFSQGYSPGRFEYLFRRSLLTEQIRYAITQSALVTERELAQNLRLGGQSRTFSQLVIPLDHFPDIEISEEAVEGYYKQHQTEFMTPEQVNLEYIELSRSDIAGDIPIDDDELRRSYAEQRARYIVPEQRQARHILIEVPEDADEAGIEEARKRADELAAQIDQGVSFEAIAKEHSEDPGSAHNGGDLGYFGRGVMDKRFEDAVFAMEVGEISEPVRSNFGFHLITLTGVKGGETESFEEVREELLSEVQYEKAENEFFEDVERLSNLAFEHPDSLDIAAEELEVEIQETGFVGRRGGPQDVGIASEAQVLAVAFSEDVLNEGNNSDLIELGSDRVVVVRVKDRKPAEQRSLVDVRDEIVGALEQQAATERASILGRELLSALKRGEDPEQVASNQSLQWERFEETSRTSSEINPEVLDVIFKLQRPEGETPSYDGIATAARDFVILALHATQDESPDAVEESVRQATEDSLQGSYGEEEYAAILEALRSGADVVVHQERL